VRATKLAGQDGFKREGLRGRRAVMWTRLIPRLLRVLSELSMPQPFRVEVRRQSESTVIVVTGELEVASATRLRTALDEAWRSRSKRVILDLRAVEFMDSTGLQLVVRAHKRAQRDKRCFAVVEGGEQVRLPLRRTGVASVLTTINLPAELLR
jgi:anti-sigma B factor antagonist